MSHVFGPTRSRRLRYTGLAAAAVLASGAALLPGAASAHVARDGKHVLVISVDGLHQSDLAWYVKQHPHSAMAQLVAGGVDYTNAQTTNPSDSFPGMIAQFTGATAGQSGVYYDDTYNHALLPPGTTDCKGATPGTEVAWTEGADKDLNALDAGQGLANLPGSILRMTGKPATLLDPANLPVDPATCKPIYPSQYLRVNTVFDVAKQSGLRTAWSDKHPAYSILEGKSGDSIDDLFTPEINSSSTAAGYPAGSDWSTDNAATRQYDGYKVQAVLNEIDGYDHARGQKTGVPAIFGMNFQTVSTGEKLPASDGLKGGYLADGLTPGPLLSSSLDWVDAQLGRFLGEIRARHLQDSTTIILSAKHGQSPTKPADLTRIPDGPIVDAVNAAWAKAHPGAKAPLVAFTVNDDAMLWWLSDRSQAAADFAKDYLMHLSGIGNDINGAPKPFTRAGLKAVYAGRAAAQYFGTTHSDPRVPDLVGVAQVGTVYTGGQKKIAEHGGANPADRDVPIVVSGAGIHTGASHYDAAPVLTTQIAPTILELLGLDQEALQTVREDHVRDLPRI
ncbi:MAG: alkaline phosphatase family protein [Actinocrinis sp.]